MLKAQEGNDMVSEEKLVKAWANGRLKKEAFLNIAEPIENAFGLKLRAFDPDFTFVYKDDPYVSNTIFFGGEKVTIQFKFALRLAQFLHFVSMSDNNKLQELKDTLTEMKKEKLKDQKSA